MEPIAIIGIGCRFPQAHGPQAFWHLLQNGIDAVTETPEMRWGGSFYDPDPTVPGKIVSRWGGFLDQIDTFDASFFKISPREAEQIDPQQRLLLETTWEALEDAGRVPGDLAAKSVGVFVGIMSNDYGELSRNNPDLVDAYTCPGNGYCIAANRISYAFDFRGPSIAVDTACSSSLVAVDLACNSLIQGTCDLAVAGGVNALLSPWGSIYFTKANLMAPDGRCKPFAADANGIVRGEGVGVIILKRLADAEVDGDTIYAVIRGTAVNQDGRTNGLTAPNRWAQEAVLRAAYEQASLSPGDVQYIEAHGTGTPLGDPIEAAAIGTVLAANRAAGNSCFIGSVKSNIGHLESAAGIAGLIKVTLALKYRQIPPTLHFQSPNPLIAFAKMQLQVNATLKPWPLHDGPALAGVNSFGFGGTNAHIVLTEAPPPAHLPYTEPAIPLCYLLPLSARHADALKALAQAYHQFLTGQESTIPLIDICYTASVRREHHPYRLAVVGRTQDELRAALAAFLQGTSHPGLIVGESQTRRRFRSVIITPAQSTQTLSQDVAASIEEKQIGHEQGWVYLASLAAQAKTNPAAQTALIAALQSWWQAWGITLSDIIECVNGDITEQVKTAIEKKRNVFLNLVPDPALAQSLIQVLHEYGRDYLTLMPLADTENIMQTLFSALGRLYVYGHPIRWKKVYPVQRPVVSLPMYPWQRQPYWLKPMLASPAPITHNGNPLLGKRLFLAHLPQDEVWELQVNGRSLNYLYDHRIQGQAIFPGAAYLEIAVAAAVKYFNSEHLILTGLVFHDPLILPIDTTWIMQIVFTRQNQNEAEFQIYSQQHEKAKWNRHVSGRVQQQPASEFMEPAYEPLTLIRDRCPMEKEGQMFYQEQTAKGNEWGITFQGIEKLCIGPDEVLAHMRVPTALENSLSIYQFHPAVLDACGHTLAAMPIVSNRAFVLSQVERVEIHAQPEPHMWSHARLSTYNDTGHKGDIRVLAEDGRILAALYGVQFHYLDDESVLANEFYKLTWEQIDRILPQTTPLPGKKWLILADKQGVGASLAAQFIEMGYEPVQIVSDPIYHPAVGRVYEIDLYDPEQFHQFLHETGPYDGIVHLWSLDVVATTEADAEALLATQISGSLATLHLVQALMKASQFPRLSLITSGAQAVAMSRLIPEQAPLWGLGRTLLQEYPEFECKLIDLNPDTLQSTISSLADEIVYRDGENQIALRAGERYAARLVRIDLEQMPTRPIQLHEQGSYLITGGLGGLGLTVAHWLAAEGARHLILLGRTPLPPRHEWAQSEKENGRFATQITAIQAIEALGAAVYPVSVDVADEAQLRAFMASYQLKYPPLRGVVHAAGIASRVPLKELDWQQFVQVLRPKMVGGWLLHRLAQDQPLDFFVFFSSAAALLSSPMLAGYAAANAYLDGLAQSRYEQNMPALSINWGPWAEVGMAAGYAQDGRKFSSNLQAITPAQGTHAFAKLLTKTAVQVAVMRLSVHTTASRLYQHLQPQAESENGDVSIMPAQIHHDLLAALPGERPVLLETYLCQQLAYILKRPITEIDGRDIMSNFSLDSLMALAMQKRVETDLHVIIPIATFYDDVSLTQLVDTILNQLHSTVTNPIPNVPQLSTSSPIPTVTQVEAAQLLMKLNTLSDQEVDVWLQQLLLEEQKKHI